MIPTSIAVLFRSSARISLPPRAQLVIAGRNSFENCGSTDRSLDLPLDFCVLQKSARDLRQFVCNAQHVCSMCAEQASATMARGLPRHEAGSELIAYGSRVVLSAYCVRPLPTQWPQPSLRFGVLSARRRCKSRRRPSSVNICINGRQSKHVVFGTMSRLPSLLTCFVWSDSKLDITSNMAYLD